MPPQPRSTRARSDDQIVASATGHHGLVTRRHLLDAGLPEHRIDYRVKVGRLTPLFRGVYRVGPVRSPREREAAALLACGSSSVLSHGTAAALLGLRNAGARAPIHVTLWEGQRAPGRGIRVHRSSTLGERDVTVVDDLRVTRPARTVFDLATTASHRGLERAFEAALRVDRNVGDGLRRLLRGQPGRRGTRRLRALLTEGTPPFTRSEAERRFLRLVERAGLPAPVTNVHVEGFEVDGYWPAARLVAEIDGYPFHAGRGAFEGDRRRDAVLAAAGVLVVRITPRQLRDEPMAVAVRLARALDRRLRPPTAPGLLP